MGVRSGWAVGEKKNGKRVSQQMYDGKRAQTTSVWVWILVTVVRHGMVKVHVMVRYGMESEITPPPQNSSL